MSLNKRIPPASGAFAGPYAAIFEFTGGGSSDVTVSGMSFQPDFIKFRQYEYESYEYICCALQGTSFWRTTQDGTGTNNIYNGSTQVIQFNSDGFTIKGNASTEYHINKSGRKYIGVALYAGNETVTNNDGTTTSTVMASPDAGFSMAKFTSAGDDTLFGHGLGSTPDVVVMSRMTHSQTFRTYYTDDVHYNNFRYGTGFLYPDQTGNSSFGLIEFPDSDTIRGAWQDEAGGNSGTEYFVFSYLKKPHQQFAMWQGNNSTSTRTVYSMTDDADPKYASTVLVDNSSSGLELYQPIADSSSGSLYRFDRPLVRQRQSASDDVNMSAWGEYIRLDWGSSERILTNSDSFYINGNYSSYNYHYFATIYGGDNCEIL